MKKSLKIKGREGLGLGFLVVGLMRECVAGGPVVGGEGVTDGLVALLLGPEEEEGPDESKTYLQRRDELAQRY